MKRSSLKRYVSHLASELEPKPYDYWLDRKMPETYDDTFMGEVVQVEIDLLEREADHVHVLVSASDGWLSQHFPVNADFITHTP